MGCFLAQNLPHVRYAADVFERFFLVSKYNNVGKFTEEEDALILNEVEKNGANYKTLAKLRNQMRRRDAKYLIQHYLFITKGKGLKTNKWDKKDYSDFFNGLFSNGVPNELSPEEFIISRTGHDILKAACSTQRYPVLVLKHWDGKIKPLLLAYHNGILHKEWKRDFLQYVVNKFV